MLAACLLAWFPPPDDAGVDPHAGAFVIAETFLALRAFLTKKPK